MDVSTTKDELVVEASLPGLRPEDVDITVEGGTLTISGQTRDERKEQEAGYLLQEIRRGSFGRSVTLPDGTADVSLRFTVTGSETLETVFLVRRQVHAEGEELTSDLTYTVEVTQSRRDAVTW